MDERNITRDLPPEEMQLHSDTPVRMIMSRAPVLIGVDSAAHVAQRLALTQGVHHLLAVDGERLRGILCICDLDVARPCALVAEVMHTRVVCVTAEVTIARAGRIVRERGVGCLPVISASRVLGVVSRRDLRRAGALGIEQGIDVCAGCGDTHGLLPARGLGPAFCATCAVVPSLLESSIEAAYRTTGGCG
jgi:CBS domain-containing protein